jgi:hypothetical protein
MLVGGFNHLEKYESQLGLLFPIYGKIKIVPNHQMIVAGGNSNFSQHIPRTNPMFKRLGCGISIQPAPVIAV